MKDTRGRSAGLICLTIADMIATNPGYTARYTIQRNDGGPPRFGRPGEWWLTGAEENADLFADGYVDELVKFQEQEEGNQVFWDEDGTVETASTFPDTNSVRQRIMPERSRLPTSRMRSRTMDSRPTFDDQPVRRVEKIQNELLQKTANWATKSGLEIGGTAILTTLQPKITVSDVNNVEKKHDHKTVEDDSDKN